MRRLVPVLMVFLAACATRPQPSQPAPEIPLPAETAREPRELLGLTPNELVGHLGSPSLQIREGSSLKLQFRSRSCVLDAYLYPQNGGTLRVTHVDARAPSGVDTNQAACILTLENPS